MDPIWRPLVLTAPSSHRPTLFVKCSFNSSSYSVFITDLAHIWTESLDRRQIIRRALNEDTSIDPSEDARQLQILLGKIEATLNGAENTERHLNRAPGSEDLVLQVTSPLPGLLGTLQWPIHLTILPPVSLRDELISPLIVTAYTQKRMVVDLVMHLEEKDHIISKLTDRLGGDIVSVFPSISDGKAIMKGGIREHAGKFVRGLGIFDKISWSEDLRQRSLQEKSIDQMFVNLSHKHNSMDQIKPNIVDHPIGEFMDKKSAHIHDNKSMSPQKIKQVSSVSSKRSEESETDETEDESNSGFQRQETPGALKIKPISPSASFIRHPAPNPSPTIHVESDDETTDDGLDGPASQTTQMSKKELSELHGEVCKPKTLAITAVKKGRLGSIGATKAKLKEPQGNQGTQGNNVHELGSLTGGSSLVGFHLAHSEITKSEPEPQQRPAFGAINGRKRNTFTNAIPGQTVPRANDKQINNLTSTLEFDAIGSIEGGNTSPRQDLKVDPEHTKFSNIPELYQTSDSIRIRADRKREELKQQLETKTKTPLKKKRRF